jgi:Family of unknown function (DUF6687)
MRFQFYSDALAAVPKLSVDGTVDNAVHFSHWHENNTPATVKADTSTEIALNVVSSANTAELTRGIELVTNNHFDTDGVLSVWTMLAGEKALLYREKLIAAAEAGDFSEFTGKEAACLSLTIQGSEYAIPDEGLASPLARYLNSGAPVGEAQAYELVLPKVERLLENIDQFEPLWKDEWQRIAAGLDSFQDGRSRVIENHSSKLSLIVLDPKDFAEFTPFTAISHNARGNLYLIARKVAGGWSYRVDYPYYSWAETVVRPEIERRDLSTVVALLNEKEKAEGNRSGEWRTDNSELSSSLKLFAVNGEAVSALTPESVAGMLDDALCVGSEQSVA